MSNLIMALESFEDLSEQTRHFASSLKEADSSAKSVELSIVKIISSLVGAKFIEVSAKALFKTFVESVPQVQILRDTLSSVGKPLSTINKSYIDATTQLRLIESILTEKIEKEGISVAKAKEQLPLLQRQEILLGSHVSFREVYSKVGIKVLAMETAIVGALAMSHRFMTGMGKELIEANSSWVERLKLTQSVLAASGATGVSMRSSTDAAKALVDVGYEMDKDFERVLRTSVMLHEGLGVSYEHAAELAVVFERQLGTSVENVADSIARIANDTALAANEAAKLSISLGRTVATLRPGLGAQLGETSELIMRYEGALKAIGGTAGGFTDMLRKMATPEGMMQAGIVGVQSPEFLGSTKETAQVLKNFTAYAKDYIGTTVGGERSWRLKGLADQFDMTAEQINLMIKATDHVNDVQSRRITLETRFREQMTASGQNLDRLTNSLKSLLAQALVPILKVSEPFIGSLANMVAKLTESRATVDALTAVIGTAGALALIPALRQFGALGRGLFTIANRAHTSLIALGAKEAVSLLPGAAGYAGATATAAARTLPMAIARGLGLAAGPLAMVISAGMAGWMLGSGINQLWGVMVKAGTDLEAQRNQISAQAADYGTVWESRLQEEILSGNRESFDKLLEEYKRHLMGVGGKSEVTALGMVSEQVALFTDMLDKQGILEVSKIDKFDVQPEQTELLRQLDARMQETNELLKGMKDATTEAVYRHAIEFRRQQEAEELKELRSKTTNSPGFKY